MILVITISMVVVVVVFRSQNISSNLDDPHLNP